MSHMMREDLLERLKRLDEDASLLFDDDRRFRMVIVGGSALILLETISRATHDIDALEVDPALWELLEKYDINTNVKAYINNFPYNFEDRLQPVPIEGQKIDFFTASLEDIVIAKLCSGRDTDSSDLVQEEVLQALDWNALDHLATAEDELKLSALNDRCYGEFKANYDEYVGRFRPCGN